MADIAQELREWEGALSTVGFLNAAEVVSRAAAEIERLQKALDTEKQAAWDAIQALIVPGELKGNGCDQLAQRNGVILAANELFYRMHPEARPSYALG